MSGRPRWVTIGKITRTHGVRGCVKILPYGETLDSLVAGDELFVRDSSEGPGRTLRIARISRQTKWLVVGLEDVDDRDAAARLVGLEVMLPEDRLPPTGDGEYYYYQLIGMEVRTVDGRPVGRLESVVETGSHDVYVVVDAQGREALVPAVAEVVTEVDVGEGVMTIDPPEGLLDDL